MESGRRQFLGKWGAVVAGAGAPTGGRGTVLQPASVPTMRARLQRLLFMLLILLEALLALVLLVGIVWWTMFSGRPKGEPPGQDENNE